MAEKIISEENPLNKIVDFVLYDEVTGDVLSSGQCSEESVQAVKDRAEVTNRLFMRGFGEQGTHKVIDGVLTKVGNRVPRVSTYTAPPPYGERRANITNDQLAAMIKQILDLEKAVEALQ